MHIGISGDAGEFYNLDEVRVVTMEVHLEAVRGLEDEVCILKGVIADMAIERHSAVRVRPVG